MKLSPRELATVLAALRYWQRQLSKSENRAGISPNLFTEAITPLTTTEIDALCQRLNFAP